MEENYLCALKKNVLNFDFEGVKRAAEEAMRSGVDPVEAITGGSGLGLGFGG